MGDLERSQRWRREVLAEPRAEQLGAVGLRWGEIRQLPAEDTCALVSFLMSDGTFTLVSAGAWLRSTHRSLGVTPLMALRVGRLGDVVSAAEMSLGYLRED